jgi:hypothetical protein
MLLNNGRKPKGEIDKTFYDGWMDGWIGSGRVGSLSHVFYSKLQYTWIGRTSVA